MKMVFNNKAGKTGNLAHEVILWVVSVSLKLARILWDVESCSSLEEAVAYFTSHVGEIVDVAYAAPTVIVDVAPKDFALRKEFEASWKEDFAKEAYKCFQSEVSSRMEAQGYGKLSHQAFKRLVGRTVTEVAEELDETSSVKPEALQKSIWLTRGWTPGSIPTVVQLGATDFVPKVVMASRGNAKTFEAQLKALKEVEVGEGTVLLSDFASGDEPDVYFVEAERLTTQAADDALVGIARQLDRLVGVGVASLKRAGYRPASGDEVRELRHLIRCKQGGEATSEQPGVVKGAKPYHFSMRHVRIEEVMGEALINRLKRVKAAYTPKAKQKALEEYLDSIYAEWKEEVGGRSCGTPIVIPQVGESCSAAQSMMSDSLGIRPGELTDKMLVVHWDLKDVFPQAPKELRELRERCIGATEALVLQRIKLRTLAKEDGTQYVYFASSPGQMKKQSGYFIRKDEYARHKEFAWAISPEQINGNCSESGKYPILNKVLQYRTLALSSAVPSSAIFGAPVKIRECICLPSWSKQMKASVRSVSAGYEIHDGQRDDIENVLFDGEALFNAAAFPALTEQFAAQFRAFWACKGLGVSLDILGLCEARGYPTTVTDVDGRLHDLRKENVKVILTTDVWKTSKLFKSWSEYVEVLERLGLDELYITATSGEESGLKELTNQMVQTLFDMDDGEITAGCQRTVEKMQRLNTVAGAWETLAEGERTEKSNFGKLVAACPSVINTDYARSVVQAKLGSKYIDAQLGKLAAKAKYHFVVADPTAFVDIAFGGKDPADPELGSLKAGECICTSVPDGVSEVAVLRSPHAFHEWGLEKPVSNKWMCGDGICYTNVHDLLYRVLQMDFDGDHVLVCWDKTWVDAARRIRTKWEIPTLYYEAMKADKPEPLPVTRREFELKVTRALRDFHRVDKVGVYATYQKHLWSTVNPQDELGTREKLREASQIAAGVNFTVDAAKTGKMEELPSSLVEKYEHKPYFRRFERMEVDVLIDEERCCKFHAEWDEATLLRGTGAIDRIGAYLETQVSPVLNLEYVGKTPWFDWKQIASSRPEDNRVVSRTVVPQDLAKVMLNLGPVKPGDGSRIEKILAAVKDGQAVGYAEFFDAVMVQNAAFWNEIDRSFFDNAKAESEEGRERSEVMTRLLIGFIRVAVKDENMPEEDALRLYANIMVRETRKVLKAGSLYYRRGTDEECEELTLTQWRKLSAAEKPLWAGPYLDVEKYHVVERGERARIRQMFSIFGEVYATIATENRA